MGYYYSDNKLNGKIKNFTPDNTETKKYISCNICTFTLEELIDEAKVFWPDCSLSNIHIGIERIHTNCIGYDLYDENDYTNYLTIEKREQ